MLAELRDATPRMSGNGCRRGPDASTVAAMEADEPLLSARLQAGDARALAEVFDAHATAVYRVAMAVLGNPATAQDVVQDVFVQLWSRPDRYDASLGGLRPYLAMCARNRAHDVVRAELRRIAREERRQELVPEPRPPLPAELVSEADTASVVRDAVLVLPEQQRRVVELAYFDGLSYREVARTLQIPEGTAKSRLRLALARLQSVLDHQLLEQS